MGGERIRLKPDSAPTKFIFTVEKPEEKSRRSSVAELKENEKKESQQHSVSEPRNIEKLI